ncbi:MAG: OmpA family protein [Myxococcaceae bacterium]|nr:OmpA family protein [Myxococcaceae bacterium]
MRRLLPALLLSVGAVTVHAEPFGARLDLGPAFAVSQPQSRYFSVGFGTQASGIWQVLPFFDLEAQLAYTVLTPAANSPVGGAGSVLGFGAGARVKRPMRGALVVPWLDVGLQLAMTGGPKLGLVPSAGALFRFNESMPIWFGVHVRLQQVFQFGALPDFDSYHASLLGIGLSAEFFPTQAEPADRDGDGVSDETDACPDAAGTEPDGCASKSADGPPDRDRDGVPDADDRCASEPEDKDGFQDDDGCPDPDDDADGVPDARDGCPKEKGPDSAGGCPDRDGDGVGDRVDACPDKFGKKDDGGCPTYREVVVTSKKIEIKQKIHFAFGKTTILPKSDPLLAEVVQALQDRPSLCVRVEGHTDSKGSAAENLKLSSGRSQAVVDHLISKGIESKRLVAKGYGSELPLDDNSTPEGRELNRRVEFVIIPCE